MVAAASGRRGLPESLDLSLVSGKRVAAEIDTGPPSWANSTWAIYGIPESPMYFYIAPHEQREFWVDGEPQLFSLLARMELGSEGEIVRVTDNAFEPRYMGDVLYADGCRHAAAEPGASYVVESYGVEMHEEVACSAFGKLFLGPIPAATAVISVSGVMAPEGNMAVGTGTLEISFDDAVWAEFYGWGHDTPRQRSDWSVIAVKESDTAEPAPAADQLPAD